MMKKNIFTAIILFTVTACVSASSIFDGLDWKKQRTTGEIELFTAENINGLRCYKAVTAANNITADEVFDILLDYEKYPEIFPKTIAFKNIKQISALRSIIHSKVDFSPLKNREYFIEMDKIVSSEQNKKKYILEWRPAGDEYPKKYGTEGFRYIKTVYGRWTAAELDNGSVFISVEYCNDWEVNVPSSFVCGVEKTSTVYAVRNLLNYLFESKRLLTSCK